MTLESFYMNISPLKEVDHKMTNLYSLEFDLVSHLGLFKHLYLDLPVKGQDTGTIRALLFFSFFFKKELN